MNKEQFQQLKQEARRLLSSRQVPKAKSIIGQLVQVAPKDLELNFLVADIFTFEGQVGSALQTLQNARQLCPTKDLEQKVLERMTQLCFQGGFLDDGVKLANEWLKISPNNLTALTQLGMLLSRAGQHHESIKAFEAGIALGESKSQGQLHAYVAGGYLKVGQKQKAYEHYQDAMRLDPENIVIPTYYLYFTNTVSFFAEQDIAQAHIDYGRRLESTIIAAPSLERSSLAKGDKIRVAYIGSEFRRHSVSYFLLPNLKGVDKDAFEIYCYSDTESLDDYSQKLKQEIDHWRDIGKLGTQAVFGLIRADQIDILVDLNGYTGKTRMDVFARRAAPIQVSYLGYPNTSGLDAMTYRISDHWADPEGMTENFHSETIIRLPNGFLCFEPDEDALAPLESPPSRDHVCFGSFNAFQKINEEVVGAWSKVMNQIEGSRILLKNGSLNDPFAREILLEWFEKYGVNKDRVSLYGYTDSKAEHFKLYDQIDLHLDTFPYNGTTTTCEALWQGVPTVSYTGEAHRARVGHSIMNQVGLGDFIAKDLNAYVELAVAKTSDIEALRSLRSGMRARMQSSPLMDKERFSKELAEAYKAMLAAY
jgi:protein O-GlcNAc transferase